MKDADGTHMATAQAAAVGSVVHDTLIDVGGVTWRRLMIKTHVIGEDDDVVEVAQRYAKPLAEAGDVLFISEKATAASQGRAIPLDQIKPRPLAHYLSQRVKKVPYGFGLGKPETMEMALREAGSWRILLAAGVHVVSRRLGRSGDFYRIAGRRVAAIDGPTTWAQPPFDRCVTLAPLRASEVAQAMADALGPGVGAAVVDVNDIGSEVLGASRDVDRELVRRALRDNPLGQGAFQTPMGLLRRGA